MVGSNPRVMDVETSGAIEQLGRRLDALEGSLRGEFRAGLGALEGSLRGEFRAGLDALEGSLRGEFRAGLDALEGSLRSEFRAGLSENRRHAEVLFETLRDDIRTRAEGVPTLKPKPDYAR